MGVHSFISRSVLRSDCQDRCFNIKRDFPTKADSKYPNHSACKIPRIFERVSTSNFRTQGSFIRISSTIFERDLLTSESVAKSATQKPWVFETALNLEVNLMCKTGHCATDLSGRNKGSTSGMSD